MPILPSTYKAPWGFGNAHLQTVLPSILRRVEGVSYRRERIETPDNDFLDIDWSHAGSDKLGIIFHGLEGNTSRHYVLGMAKMLNNNGWDALAVNFRSCSGVPNRQIRSYHSGMSEDVETLVRHVMNTGNYRSIGLVGFSLGGNVVLKYLGDRGNSVPSVVKAAACFSVLCDLRSGAIRMEAPDCRIYMSRFLKMLREKIRAKMELFPGLVDDAGYERIRNFRQFDDRYTAPMNGFRDAEDYWKRSSCKPLIPNIAIPALLVNAGNDPFFAEACYPVEEAKANSNFFLEMPRSGGHVGFMSLGRRGTYWSEHRMMDFFRSIVD